MSAATTRYTNQRNLIMKFVTAIIAAALLSSCSTDADVASHNLSMDAGAFKLTRRVVFYNGITDTYLLTIEGRCQVDKDGGGGNWMAVTCKTGENEYKKHYLGLSDNVTYFSEQVDAASVDVYRYKVVFKPEAIVPDVELRTSKQP